MVPRGIYTPIPTFFKKDCKTIDFDTQTKHAQFLKDNGISGVVVMGSTGELAHLTRDERALVVSNIHKTVPGLVIMGGVGQHCLEDALAEILSLKNAGATHALVLPSSYYGASLKQQGIIDWYTEVADKSELPLLVYIYPGVCNNVVVEPTTIVTLSKHPKIVGTKLSHGDISHYISIGLNEEVKKNVFACFTGLGQILLPALSVGFQGTVDALSGAFPKLYVNIMKSYDAGDLETARKLQYVATRGEELVVRYGVVGIKKAIYTATGFGETYLGRAPLNQDVALDWDVYAHYLVACAEVEATL
ncbi:CIC11C00000001657 [Sungouiella intermedia]|uniref:CIC11C00000001657 n=1 Tax=Sungouiella intermedia TaxID=45354 RepID=A0A1L0DAH6_9ASCO|nr:CIC11C00000001657 [[Candida] intermedia]